MQKNFSGLSGLEGRHMRNINELVGIIKGINFDGVINQMEIIRLQSWVNKNRNLAYDTRQSGLIKLVDQVLEEQIVTGEERNILLEYCKNNLDSSSDATAKIYELNGIIEGIICDNVVNESEVYRLKEWMNENGDVVRGYKPTDSICKMIDEILEDGIVTEEEQERLLQILSARISDTQLETKIAYLCKCVRERKNIGIDLIDLLDNEVVIREIHERAEKELLHTLNSYSGIFVMNPEILFISLVLVAMLYYDGTFYDYVRVTYKKAYEKFSEQKVEGLIRTNLNRYRSVEERIVSKSRIINVVLANTIVPSRYLSSFFEFIYDIYKLNFDYDISHDLYSDFRFVFEGLRDSMLSDGDDIQLNVTKKSYKLIKTTKQLIAESKNIDAVIKLGIIVVQLIDKSVWNQEIKLYNPYLKQGYEGWIKTLKEQNDTRTRERSEFRSRWEPKFLIVDNKILLAPPIHQVKAQYDYRNLSVNVLNGEEEIYCNYNPDIREIIGGYQISVNRIVISQPLGNLSYRVMSGSEVIYNSKESLNREFLVFDEKGYELSNNTDYTGTAIFCVKCATEKMHEFYKGDEYVLTAEHVKEGDAFLLGDMVFNFSSLVKPGIMGEQIEHHFLQEVGANSKILVYKSVKALVFESSNSVDRLSIVINGKNHKIKDFRYTISPREGINKFVVSLDKLETGIYQLDVLELVKGKKNNIWNSVFAIDRHMHVETVIFDAQTYLISIDSALMQNQVFDEISISKFEIDWLKVNVAGKVYTYYIPYDFNIYRVNGGHWQSFEQSLWIGEIRQDSVIDIYGDNYDAISVLTSDGSSIDEVLELKGKGIFAQAAIGFLVSYKSSYDYVVILLMKESHVCSEIFCYNRCILDEEKTEILYNHVSKTLDVIPRFYGKGNVFFRIISESGEEVYTSTLLEDGMEESIYDLKSFRSYTIIFFEKEKGLSLKKERILKEYSLVFYDRQDFIGKTFKIKEVYFDQFVRGEFLRKKHYFNTTYVYFTEMKNDDCFIGEVYARTSNGAYMLNNINPVEIEICSDVINGIIELSITKDGDGLLMDFNHHGIMNSLDDENAVDIYSYSMDMRGEETF